MDLSGFNANEVEPLGPREPIPPAWYKAVAVQGAEKPTKSQTGSYLELAFEVIEGEHQGYRIIDRLNLNNPNSTAVEIAQRTLSSICRAVSVATPRDSSDLLDKTLMIKVKVRPATGEYGPQNEISEYAPVGKQTTAASEETSEAKAKPPWKR